MIVQSKTRRQNELLQFQRGILQLELGNYRNLEQVRFLDELDHYFVHLVEREDLERARRLMEKIVEGSKQLSDRSKQRSTTLAKKWQDVLAAIK